MYDYSNVNELAEHAEIESIIVDITSSYLNSATKYIEKTLAKNDKLKTERKTLHAKTKSLKKSLLEAESQVSKIKEELERQKARHEFETKCLTVEKAKYEVSSFKLESTRDENERLKKENLSLKLKVDAAGRRTSTTSISTKSTSKLPPVREHSISLRDFSDIERYAATCDFTVESAATKGFARDPPVKNKVDNPADSSESSEDEYKEERQKVIRIEKSIGDLNDIIKNIHISIDDIDDGASSIGTSVGEEEAVAKYLSKVVDRTSPTPQENASVMSRKNVSTSRDASPKRSSIHYEGESRVDFGSSRGQHEIQVNETTVVEYPPTSCALGKAWKWLTGMDCCNQPVHKS